VAVVQVLFIVVTLGCSPKAQPVDGPVADQVVAAIASGTERFDHSTWDSLLAEGTKDGLVDYRFFERNRPRLDQYLADIAAAELSTLEGDQLMALLINAYNAYTVQSILDHPGITSIRDIDGVWDTRSHDVGGHQLTLDNIEHNILRPIFKDPRIHVAVNCASQSCAPLPPWAFAGEELEQQLDDWTRSFFNNDKYTRIEGDKLMLSKLLDWYGDDFLLPEADPRADSLIAFVALYNDEVASRQDSLEVEFLDYDWGLNQVGSTTDG
jgi:hypothetical protein